MARKHSPELILPFKPRKMTPEEHETLLSVYRGVVAQVDREVVQGGISFRYPDQRKSEVRRRTIAEVTKALPRFADTARWLMDSGQYRSVNGSGRMTPLYRVWGRSQQRGTILAERWIDPETGLLAFVLEVGELPPHSAVYPDNGRLDPENFIVKLHRGVGKEQAQPTDAALVQARKSDVEPALIRHGMGWAWAFDLTSATIAMRIADWRHRGLLGKPWASLPHYRAVYAIAAYLLDEGLMPGEGEELFRLNQSGLFEPGNIGVRSRHGNRRYRVAA